MRREKGDEWRQRGNRARLRSESNVYTNFIVACVEGTLGHDQWQFTQLRGSFTMQSFPAGPRGVSHDILSPSYWQPTLTEFHVENERQDYSGIFFF